MNTFSNVIGARWFDFSLETQLANIGSEVSRLILWHKKKKDLQIANSLARALDLIDATLMDVRWVKKKEEFEKLREVILSIGNKNDLKIDTDSIEEYFAPFYMIAALKQRSK